MDYRKIELAKEAFWQMYRIAQHYREQAQQASQRAEELEKKAEMLNRELQRLREQGEKEDISLQYLKTIANDVGGLQRMAELYTANQDRINKAELISGIHDEVDELFSQLLMNIHEEIDGLQNVIEHSGQKERDENFEQNVPECEELEQKEEKEEKNPFEGIGLKFE